MRKLIVCLIGLTLIAGTLPMPKAFSIDQKKVEINIFMPGATEDISFLSDFEQEMGFKFNTARYYMDWSDDFNTGIAKRFHNHGTIPDLTWQPQLGNTGVDYSSVLVGNYDKYITDTAKAIKSLGFEIRICLGPEMNGDWATWGINIPTNGPENQKLFWRYVVNKFRRENVTNVAWVWSPNVHFWGEEATYADLFPGDEYVDYVGLDGYNWGTSQSWAEWQSFDEVFGQSYRDLLAISQKSVLISEIGSAEVGGDKAKWITNMFEVLPSKYPRIKGFTWFNILKETDWRINSSAKAKQAFIAGVESLIIYQELGSSPPSSTSSTPSTSSSVNRSSKSAAPNLSGKTIQYVKTDEQIQDEVLQAIDQPVVTNDREVPNLSSEPVSRAGENNGNTDFIRKNIMSCLSYVSVIVIKTLVLVW